MKLTFLGMFFTFGRRELAPVTWIALGIANLIGGLINLGYVHHLDERAKAAQRWSEAQNPGVTVG